jgi:hypothetical protein
MDEEARWAERLGRANISKAMLDQLVMDYLVIEGHKEAAASFMAETGTSGARAFRRAPRTHAHALRALGPPAASPRAAAGVDLETVGQRMSIRAAVEAGDLARAVERTNELNPQVLVGNEPLLFRLQQQQLIEHIRAGRVEEALDFAQRELAPVIERTRADDQGFLEDLERTMLLLAYEDAREAPTAELLGLEQRRRTAGELNAAILHSQQQQQTPQLTMMVRLLQWAQDELQHKQVAFPRIDSLVDATPQLTAAAPGDGSSAGSSLRMSIGEDSGNP